MRPLCSLIFSSGRPLRRMAGGGLAAALVFGLGVAAGAADYYVSPHGSDSSPGTRSRPWQSLAKVNAAALKPGDRVLLASGATFTGSLVLNDTEAGLPGKPIVVCSSGKQRATISALGQTAISAVCGGIEIRGLVLKGAAAKSDKIHGISFYTEDKRGVKYRDIRIADVEISGFGDDGLSLGSGGDGGAGYENVSIARVNSHDNYGSGIATFNKVSAEKPSYAHKNFYITDCTVGRNHSGTGMVIAGVDHAVIEFCRAFGNDGHGGGVGLWAYAAKDVTFQHCIASGTTTHNGGDGGGFDLDGACVGCTVQSCLTYGNDGPGYMHCDYPSATPTRSNIIRASVSVNDGRKAKGSAYGFGFCTWGSGLDACTITDNLTIVTKSDPQRQQNGIYWVSYIPESPSNAEFDKGRQHLSGSIFRRNIALVAGSGVAYVTNDMPGATPANVLFQGNSFRAGSGAAPLFVQGETRYATAAQWRTATGQETPGSLVPAKTLSMIGPDLAKTLSRITDPHVLPKLSLMKTLNLAGMPAHSPKKGVF